MLREEKRQEKIRLGKVDFVLFEGGIRGKQGLLNRRY